MVGLQDVYKQLFETKDMSAIPGIGSIELFVAKVTGGA